MKRKTQEGHEDEVKISREAREGDGEFAEERSGGMKQYGKGDKEKEPRRVEATHSGEEDKEKEPQRAEATHSGEGDKEKEPQRAEDTHSCEEEGGREPRRAEATHSGEGVGGREPRRAEVTHSVDFRKFNAENRLNWRSREKLLIVKGKFEESADDSLLILQKNPFPENLSDINKSFSQDNYEIENIMRNDIYGTYSISGMNSINSIKVTVISPATEKHIRKYSKPQIHFISETPLIYDAITFPFISNNQFSTHWVTNIINGTEEADRVLYRSESNSFLIVMDFKWDGLAKEDLHCLAIFGHDAPRSLRDLRSAHLVLLKEIYNTAISVISNKYRIPSSQLRLFLHYPPSFYHLHVHITHIHNDSASALVDRAHLLSSVIRNIESSDEYYKYAILDVTVQDNDPLYKLYEDNKFC